MYLRRCRPRLVVVALYFHGIYFLAWSWKFNVFFYFISSSPHLMCPLLESVFLIFNLRMLNLFAFYLKLHSERVVYIFKTVLFGCFWFWVAFSFYKFPMLITARFTPNQNKLQTKWNRFSLAHAFTFAYVSLCVYLVRCYMQCNASLVCSLTVRSGALYVFLQVFSVALMYAYQNIQMFTLSLSLSLPYDKKNDTNT